MIRGRPHPVQPRAAVLVPRRGERGSGKLLGIEPEGRTLRRIATLGERAADGLAFEMAAEPGHVAQAIIHAPRVNGSAAHNQTGAVPRNRARARTGTRDPSALS